MIVLAALLVLGAGAATHRKSRCRSIYGIAFVCDAGAATSPAQRLGNAWQFGMNLYGQAHHGKYRIKHIVCTPDGEALARCKFAVVNVAARPNRVTCMSATIATDGRVFQPKTIRCDYLPSTGTVA